MFTKNFYPTPLETIEKMLVGYEITGKIILEPSAGKGDIIDYLISNQAKKVICCELHPELRKIAASKCNVISDDFLKVESHAISHIDMIVMNPPFEDGAKHILHAFKIAPAGCKIVALCNLSSIKNPYTRERNELGTTIDQFGQYKELYGAFSTAERKSDVEVALVKLEKPSANYNAEFEGFFLDEEPEEQGEAGAIMPYDFIRDLVNRYVGAVKIFDEQLKFAVAMNDLTSGFYSCDIGLSITKANEPIKRNDFKKEMQKSGWKFIFSKMNMQKFATRGLRDDINKFVEQQTNIPFTMKNIYHMLDIVIGTNGQRMDKAIEEVFDNITRHHNENRFGVEGFQTNSHYVLNETFIMTYVCPQSKYDNGNKMSLNYGGQRDLIDDMAKAMCFLTGTSYEETTPIYNFVSNMNCEYGTWYEWGFFEFKGFKKGTMHFKFNSKELWAMFNRKIAQIKGYPLPENKTQTKWQQQRNNKKSAA